MEWTSPSGTPARLQWRAGSAVRSQAARGSAAAFAAVYERHHRALYRYCCSLLGDDEEARDALQSTMAKAFAALRFEERDFELRPWLFRIAHNEAVSRLRQRRDAVDLDGIEALSTDSLVQAVELRERLAQLRADLQDLPERQRAALVMRELSGLGHAEIAAVLGGSPQTVKQTIFEARTALHQCAEGRGMSCAEVQRMLSDGDGRVRRGRRVRAHVRACRACREFEAGLAERPARLAALAPGPPAAAAATWLSRLLAATGGSSAGGASWVTGGVAGTLAGKAVAVVVAAATCAGAATAVRDVARETSSRPASALRSHPSAAGAADVRRAVGRAAQPPVLSSRRPATSDQQGEAPAVRAPATTAPLPTQPGAGPAPAARGREAESAKKPSHLPHPSGVQSASKAHGRREGASPAKGEADARQKSSDRGASAKRVRGEHAGGSGQARRAPPGQAEPAHAGDAKPAHAGDAKPIHAGDAKSPASGAAPPATASAGAAGDAAAGSPPEVGAPGHAHGSK
jgi:RNA polymerase sigma factor (sigma-70 family)